MGDPFSEVPGLVNLQNVTYALDDGPLLAALLQTPMTSITFHIISPSVTSSFQAGCANLTEVVVSTAVASVSGWTNCTNLSHLLLGNYDNSDLSQLSIFANSLRSLEILQTLATVHDPLSSLVNLESLLVYSSKFSFSPTAPLPRLTSIEVIVTSATTLVFSTNTTFFPQLTNVGLSGFSLVQANSFSDSIRSLIVMGTSISILAPSFPASLESLELIAPSITLSSASNMWAACSRLDSVSIKASSLLTVSFPWNLRTTALTKLILSTPTLASNAAATMCTAPATLRSFTLSQCLDLAVLPACFGNGSYPFLQEVVLNDVASPLALNSWTMLNASSIQALDFTRASFALPPSQWALFLNKFPNLQSLALADNGLTQFPKEITKLGNLRLLDISGNSFNGTFPALGAAMPELTTLHIFQNAFEGALDLSGLSKLRQLGFDDNYFTDFPTPSTPAPVSLFSISYKANKLNSVPSDAWFAQLDSIVSVELHLNPALRRPLPTWWATSPTLGYLNLESSGLVGTLPSLINAPHLSTLRLKDNQLSGTFPSFAPSNVPLYMDVSVNQLGGTLPVPIYGPRFAVILFNVSRNQFVGPFTDAHLPPVISSSFSLDLDLSYNLFCGPAPNMTSTTLTSVALDGTTFDFCVNTSLTAPTALCSVSHLPYPETFCSCPGAYSQCTGVPSPNCTDQHQGVPDNILQFCRPNLVACPQPPPIGSFACAPDGSWQLIGNIEQPRITIPEGGVVLVSGNVNITDSLTFNGISGHLVVDGCITIGPGGIVVELTPQQLEQIPKKGLQQSLITSLSGANNCSDSTDLSTVPITVKMPKSCKRVTVTNGNKGKVSTRSSMVAIFEIDTSRCNLTAILAPSIVAGAVVLGVAIFLAVTRPWQRKKMPTASPSSSSSTGPASPRTV